jgi:hypothetical protein
VTDDAGTACYGSGATSSFAGVVGLSYWSSSVNEINPSRAWAAELGNGVLRVDNTANGLRVWPVRGGTR